MHTQRRMTERLMKKELVSMWKEAVAAQFKYYLAICLDGRTRTTKKKTEQPVARPRLQLGTTEAKQA